MLAPTVIIQGTGSTFKHHGRLLFQYRKDIQKMKFLLK